MLRNKLVFAVIAGVLAGTAICGQSGKSAVQRWGDPDGFTGRDCETSMALLDFVAIAHGDAADEDKVIVVIARPGTGETSRSLMRARLKQVADYLKRRVSRDRIVTAEGERIRGLAQIEFYVSGKLHTVIKVKRNHDLVRGCAEVNSGK